jgi:PTS system mannose-specific IIA component
MFGGTPTNIATALLDPGKVEIVTGVNLPMLIALAEVEDGTSLTEVARRVRDAGQKSIHIASDLLAPRKGP